MRKCKLGDIAEFKNGINYEKTEIGHKYSCIGVSDFKNKTTIHGNYVSSSIELDSELNDEYFLQDEDILLVRSNGNKQLIGRSILVYPDNRKITYSGFCIRCRIIDKNVYPKFIFLKIKDALNHGIFAKSQQTNINNINQSLLGELDIILPESNIQKKLADMYFYINDKIGVNNRLNATLEAMAKTLYDYWFVQFDFPDEHGRPYKTSGGSMMYNEELGREIPTGWEVTTIGNVLGKYPRTESILRDSYQKGNMYPIIDQSQKFICGYTDCKEFLLHLKDAIVFGDHTNISKYVNFDFARGADGTQIITSAICRLPNYLLYMQIISLPIIEKGYSRHFKFLKQQNIFIPFQEISNLYTDKVTPMLQKKREILQENRRLTQLRDFLLPLLMNGQVTFK